MAYSPGVVRACAINRVGQSEDVNSKFPVRCLHKSKSGRRAGESPNADDPSIVLARCSSGSDGRRQCIHRIRGNLFQFGHCLARVTQGTLNGRRGRDISFCLSGDRTQAEIEDGRRRTELLALIARETGALNIQDLCKLFLGHGAARRPD